MEQEQKIRNIYNTVSSHDAKKFVDLFAEDAIFSDKVTGQVFRGKSEILGMIDSWFKGFSDFKLVPDKIMGSGDTYTVELTASGTHDGTISGPEGDLPASGKKVSVPSCDVIQLKGDKIQSINCYYAAPLMLSQIGASVMGQTMRSSTQTENRQSLS